MEAEGEPPAAPAGGGEGSRRGGVGASWRLIAVFAVVVLAAVGGFLVRGAFQRAPDGDGAARPSAAPSAPVDVPTAVPATSAAVLRGAAEGGPVVVVEAVEVTPEGVRVTVEAANPAGEERSLAQRFDPAVLAGPDGQEVAAEDQELALGPYRHARQVLTFPGPAPAAEADLRFNSAGAAIAEPALEVTRVPLTPGTTAFARPPQRATALRDLVVHHPAGVSVALRTFVAGPATLELGLEAVNGGEDEVRLGADAPYLEAPDGRRFPAVPPAADPELRVPAHRGLTGTLRFPGPLPEDVDELALVLNGRRGDDGERTRVPGLRVEGIDLSAAGPSGTVPAVPVTLPGDTPLDLRTAHPAGTTVEVLGVSYHDDRVQLRLRVRNDGDQDVALAALGMVLQDDLGTRYRVSPAPADPDLTVPRGATLEGTAVFLGRVLPGAARLTLVTNERAGNSGPGTLRPTIVVDGIPAPTPPPAPAAPARPAPPAEEELAAGSNAALPRSELRTSRQVVSELGVGVEPNDAEVPAADAGATERTLADLGAVRTPEGLVVALPERVLFDLDQATIRADAQETLRRIAEVLAFYPDVQADVRGHTDSSGDTAYNQTLSERRAAAVAEALSSRFGVPAGRLRPQGFGETSPAVPERRPDGSDDLDARQQNRRVEVVLRQV